MIRIEAKNPVSFQIENHDGTPIKGVGGFTIVGKPYQVTTATIELQADKVDIQAHPLLGRETLEWSADALGLMTANFAEILTQHRRVAIAGGPRVGKSTLAATVTDRRVIATDDYMGKPWADIPQAIIADIGDLDAFVLEGVQVARTLRKGLQVDAVVFLARPKVAELLKGHVSLAKGVARVFGEWRAASPGVPVYFETAGGLVLAGAA